MLVSIIIPCKNETVNVQDLLEDISCQKTSFETEVIRIIGVSPGGKARNVGADKAKGDILVFIDNDITLGNDLVLHNLIKHLMSDKKIGVICSSIRIPQNASAFQKRYAREIPHAESPIVPDLKDVAVATSACCAILRDVFFKIGKFDEKIGRGEDPELSHRIAEAGYRVVLAGNTWCYHPAPDSMIKLMNINFRNGYCVCFVDTYYPERNIDVHPDGIVFTSEQISYFQRLKRFVLSGAEAARRGSILLLLSKLFYTFGYFHGIVKHRIMGYEQR